MTKEITEDDFAVGYEYQAKKSCSPAVTEGKYYTVIETVHGKELVNDAGLVFWLCEELLDPTTGRPAGTQSFSLEGKWLKRRYNGWSQGINHGAHKHDAQQWYPYKEIIKKGFMLTSYDLTDIRSSKPKAVEDPEITKLKGKMSKLKAKLRELGRVEDEH